VLKFRMLVLQALHGLPLEQSEYLVRDRRGSERRPARKPLDQAAPHRSCPTLVGSEIESSKERGRESHSSPIPLLIHHPCLASAPNGTG
jgi:hypothetical protein